MIFMTRNEMNRPKIHFTPPMNWMNDPNGLVYFGNEYHLFYQHNPYGAGYGSMHWGHAVSRDLIVWEHLPIALAPDELGVIYSGCVVIDMEDTSGFFNGNPGMVAVFTHHKQGDGIEKTECQSLAYSRDNGRTWMKYSGNPVLSTKIYQDFRDPKVFWHKEMNRWIMVLACGSLMCIYHSYNLKEWSFSSKFGEGIGSLEGVLECPDLFSLPMNGDKTNLIWVLMVSTGKDSDSINGYRTQYFIGQFDGTRFIPDEGSCSALRLDYGIDNYASATWSNIPAEDGRRICIGWMSNWKYALTTPEYGWRHMMTIPKELSIKTIGGEKVLFQNPIREREGYRVLALDINGENVDVLNSKLRNLSMDAYEIVADIQYRPDVESFGFQLRRSEKEETVVGYLVKSQVVFLDRTKSGNVNFHKDFPSYSKTIVIAENQSISLRICVDISSIEVFINDGYKVITDSIFPSPDSSRMLFFCTGNADVVYNIKIYLYN